MESPLLDEVAAAIAAVGGKSEFAVEEYLTASELGLRVRGVGRVRLPVGESAAKQIIAAAQPAPFGVRDETRYDERVRSTWEIAAAEITLDATFEQKLAASLPAIRRRLGLPLEGAIRPVLDKLLVYGPGQFFAPHQDSERKDGMLATLVIVLPSRHTGGSIAVAHNGQRLVFAAAGRDRDRVTLVAFYADCRHEVEPVKSGHRVALTFHLVHDGAAAERPKTRGAAADRLAASIDAYFSTRVRPRYGRDEGEVPDRLLYLLDHEYTQRGLAFTRLKGKDRTRVSALLKVAQRLDYEAYLALAEVHEVWNCEGDDDWHGSDGHYGRSRRVDRPKRAAEDYELLDLCDSGVTLSHWVGRDGAKDPGVLAAASSDELCSTRPSVEMTPFRSEHEGYMGNYGNTVDRWYHRAALVLWPRSRAFIVWAKASPSWAIEELSRRLAAGEHEQAAASAESLLPFWRHGASQVKKPAFTRRVAKVAVALGHADLAAALLGPLGPGAITGGNIPAFLAVAERFGIEWTRRLLTEWRGEHRSETSVLEVLPAFGRALATHRWPDARPLGLSLLQVETTAFRSRCVDHKSSLSTRNAATVRGAIAQDAIALVEAAVGLEEKGALAPVLRALTEPETALPAAVLAEVLNRCLGKRSPNEVRGLGLAPLHDHVTASLRASLARPARSPDDWSLAPALDCACELCQRLSNFLRDKKLRQLPWPLAKERRRHVHGVIDRFDLPVAHDTIRTGRPFTLMLEKQAVLFSREAAERASETQLLAELEHSRTMFISDVPGKSRRGSGPRGALPRS